MSFIRRELQFILSYGTGEKGEGPPERVLLTGHRASVVMNAAGGIGMGQLNARIYGLKLSLANRVTTIGSLPTLQRRNTIAVAAGDSKMGVSQIFEGTITQAWGDFGGMPDVFFNITAATGLIESLQPTPPSSFPGSVDAAVIMQGLAKQAGLRFENSGVSVQLATPYLKGSLREQMAACAAAGQFTWYIDEKEAILAIWPRGGYRSSTTVPLISSETGMKGYPSYTSTGLMVETQYNPAIQFGALVEVKSTLTPACGRWRVISLTHDLDAEAPGGKWFTQMQLAATEQVVVLK